jgi:hypothetical protein
MHRLLSLTLALGLGANGLFMLAAPAAWFAALPGVDVTGPFNPHFVRDVGAAYLVAALGLAWLARDRERAWPAALAGGLFLGLHALVHLLDALAGRAPWGHLVLDAPLVGGPAALALWLAWPRGARATEPRGHAPHAPHAPHEPHAPHAPHEPTPHGAAPRRLLSRLAEPSLARFERRYGYDVSYLRELCATSPSGFVRFSLATMLGGERRGVTKDAWYAVKLATLRLEDCGPCTQLIVHMAREDGVEPRVLRAILQGDHAAMPADVRLAVELAEASLARDLEASATAREAVLTRFGRRGLATLALGIAGARLYPTVKYAMGHGQTCSRVELDGERVLVQHLARPTPEHAA